MSFNEAQPPPGDPQRPARHSAGHRAPPGTCRCAATAGACAPRTALGLAGLPATGKQGSLACAVCHVALQTASRRPKPHSLKVQQHITSLAGSLGRGSGQASLHSSPLAVGQT